MNKNLKLSELKQFSASESFFKIFCDSKMIYTEGVRYLVEQAECNWLVNEICYVLLPQLLKKYCDHFYAINFLVDRDSSAMIVVGDGNGKVHLTHKINWTDFPIIGETIKFYLCESENGYCLMLPSEY